MSDALKGYKGEARLVLEKFNIRVWSDTVIDTTRGKFEGIILPRSENDDDLHIVLVDDGTYVLSSNISIDLASHTWKETLLG